MLSDAAYNAQMGAAELGDVLESYRGSYILSFVAYNAGRGRVKQWIEKYGDPRDPERRSDRLGRAHPVLGDAQLRPARAGEHAGLSRPARQRLAPDDRGGPAPRRRGELIAKRRRLPYALSVAGSETHGRRGSSPRSLDAPTKPASPACSSARRTACGCMCAATATRAARPADRLPARPHPQRRGLSRARRSR